MWRGRTVRDWLVDVGLAAAVLLFGAFMLAEALPEDQSAALAIEISAGLTAAALLILLRRSHPVALTLVLIPVGIVFAAPMAAAPVALFTVALHKRIRVVAALGVLHAVLVASVYRLALGAGREYVEAVVFLVVLDGCLIAVALLMRSHRSLVRSLAARARQAEDGQRMHVEQARLAERQRIAREMHDVLAHRISLLAVHAGAIEVRRSAPADERAAAGVIRQCAYDALEDLREVIGTLREHPDEDRPQPTLDDLPALAEQSRAAGVAVELELDARPGAPALVGRHAYRIVQEALTNARKHAPGAAVRVAVRGRGDDGLEIEVDNALRPGGALPGAGAGLIGLRERVELAGGRLAHGPTAAGTFELRAWLPWQA